MRHASCKIYEVPNADPLASRALCVVTPGATHHLILDGLVIPLCERHRLGFDLWREDSWVYGAALGDPTTVR